MQGDQEYNCNKTINDTTESSSVHPIRVGFCSSYRSMLAPPSVCRGRGRGRVRVRLSARRTGACSHRLQCVEVEVEVGLGLGYLLVVQEHACTAFSVPVIEHDL
jgi:hypothetical protein